MNFNPLKTKLDAGDSCVGLWVTLESAAVTEIAVALGVDWITVDMEHGHLDFKDVMDHLRASRGSETSVVVRVPRLEEDSIRRVLDWGAHGVSVPLIKSGADGERARGWARYPPAGTRGVGGERAVAWGLAFDEYLEIADRETMVIPLIEAKVAVDAIDEILEVGDLTAVFLGPNDLSASQGHLGQWEGPGVAEQLLHVCDRAAARGIATGVMALDVENAQRRKNQGFRMVGLGSDTGLMIRSLRDSLRALDR